MKKQFITFFIIFVILVDKAFAQSPVPTDTVSKQKIAILAPLYLDDAFSDYTYKLSDKGIPQYILTGLDFYNGVMLAVDALERENANIEVWVYDTKKQGTDISAILKGMAFQNFSLLIASLNNPEEQKVVSDFSFSNNIPVVSATYPNDANVTDNPFFVLLNSTLKTHVNGVYRYVQQNYTGSRPLFITKDAPLENRILSDFRTNDTTTYKFLYQILTLNSDEVSISNLAPFLDSNKANVIICGSLNTTFAGSIINALCDNPQYRVTLIGMPNWDGLRKLNTVECNSLEVIYSTPYNYSRSDSVGYRISKEYRDKFYARPSDMVYKGYEAMYHFTHLLLDYKHDFINHLSDDKYVVSNNFYIKPVVLSSTSQVPAYLENQNLYFIKKINGQVASVSNPIH